MKKKHNSVRFFAIFSIITFGILFNTCKNVISLGDNVDVRPPEVSIVTPEQGSFLADIVSIIVDASDDQGILSVVADYTYRVDGGVEHSQRGVPLELDEESGLYLLTINTIELGMVDGPFSATFTATDTSEKTASRDLVSTIKNNPPTVNMQIPRPKIENDELVNTPPYPAVVTDNYLMGVFEDLAGVAPGYPLIKFWRGDNEPEHFSENAGWQTVTGYTGPGTDGWVLVDEGFPEIAAGERGGSFRYYLRNRNADGTPMGEGHGLEAGGGYRLKLKAADINGKVIEWPRDAYPNAPEYMIIDIVATGFPPEVVITGPLDTTKESPELQLHHSNNFTITASASLHPMDELNTEIVELTFEVTGRNNEGVSDQIILYRRTEGDIDIEDGKSFGSLEIEIGKTYYSERKGSIAIKVESEENVPLDAYAFVTFNDGNFNFKVSAVGDSGSTGNSDISIYIDRTPPRTEVTSVSPHFSQDNPTGDGTRQWTVNKSINISVNSTDNRGNATYENGDMKFKFLMFEDLDINNEWEETPESGTFAQYLYQMQTAELFDEIRRNPDKLTWNNPNEKGDRIVSVDGRDGDFTLTLQTQGYHSRQEENYLLWFYIVAVDNAGNYEYQKILLNVDQETDKPRINFGNINADGSTFMDNNFNIRLEITDDHGFADGFASGDIEYRFAKNENERDSADEDDEALWRTITTGIRSSDGRTISIDNLTLAEIETAYGGTGALGSEIDTKFIQVRATDDADKKVYPNTDDPATGTSGWMSFGIDLTPPVVVPSTTDLSEDAITGRTTQDPFGLPQRDASYGALNEYNEFAYGDIKEVNLSAITVRLNGVEVVSRRLGGTDDSGLTIYEDVSVIPEEGFAVWKTEPEAEAEWEGELRWRIPMADILADTLEGAQSFEINFTDRVNQNTVRAFTFFTDMEGPAVSFINPGTMQTLEDDQLDVLEIDYEELRNIIIMDRNASIIGTFTDSFSDVASSFEYRIDDATTGDWVNGTWETITFPEQPGRSANWEIPLTGRDDGIYRLSIRVKDALGNGYDSVEEPTETDQRGPGFVNNAAFILDRSTPNLALDTLENNIIGTGGGNFILNGTVTETFVITHFTVSIGDTILLEMDGDELYNDENEYIDKEKTLVKNIVFKDIPVSVSALEYGPQSLMVGVTGSSGQTAMAPLNIIYDNQGPQISFNTTGGELIRTGDLPANIADRDSTDWPDTPAAQTLYETRIIDNIAMLRGSFIDDYSFIYAETGRSFQFRIDTLDANGVLQPEILAQSKMIDSTADRTSATWEISLPNNLEDGIYALTIEVQDRLGNSTEENGLVFMLDRSAPTLNAAFTNGIVLGPDDDITISGTVTNTFDVRELSITIPSISGLAPLLLQGSDDISGKSGVVTRSDSKTFSFTINEPVAPGTFVHGPHELLIRAVGSSGQVQEEKHTFTVDKKGPNVTLNITDGEKIKSLTPADVLSYNSLLRHDTTPINPHNWTGDLETIYTTSLKSNTDNITVTVTDDYSNVKAAWFKLNTGVWTPVTTLASGSGAFGNSRTVSFNIPLAAHLPTGIENEGIHLLSIRVLDTHDNGASNTTGEGDLNAEIGGFETNLAFMVDRRRPSFANVPAELATLGPLSTENVSISGNITNTFDVKSLNVMVNGVEYEDARIGSDHEDSNKESLALPSGFGFNFTIPKTLLTAGSNAIMISATGSSGATEMISRNVILDNQGPAVGFIRPSVVRTLSASDNISALLVNSTGIVINDINAVLMGTFTDEHSDIAGSFEYRIENAEDGAWVNGTSWVTLPISGAAGKSKNWEIPLSGSMPDGIYRLSIKVKDSLGNENSSAENTAFILDRSVPKIELTNEPNRVFGDGNGGLTLSGLITETFFVNNVTVSLDGGTDLLLANFDFNDYIDEDNTTFKEISFKDIPITLPSGLAYGPQSLMINITGSSGQNAMVPLNFIYDDKGPDISFNTTEEKIYINNGDTAKLTMIRDWVSRWNGDEYDTLFETRIKDNITRLTGNFSDEYSPVTGGFNYRIDRIDVTPIQNNVVQGTIPIANTANRRTVAWEIPLTDPALVDGIYRLSISVQDSLGNPSVNNDNYNMAFMLDRTVPTITLTAPPVPVPPTEFGTIYAPSNNTNITISGTLTNTYLAEQVNIQIPRYEMTTITSDDLTQTGVKEFSFNLVIPISDISHGLHNINVTALGSSGQSGAAASRIFTVDKLGPEVTLRNRTDIHSDSGVLANNEGLLNNTINPRSWDGNLQTIYNASIRDDSTLITVDLTDDYSSVKEAWYRFNNAGNWQHVTDFTVVDKTSSFTIPLVDLPADEGIHLLSIRAMDMLGNGYNNTHEIITGGGNSGYGYENNLTFMIDRRPPVLSLTDAESDVYSGTETFTVTGKVNNTFDVTRLSLSINGVERTVLGATAPLTFGKFDADDDNEEPGFIVNIPVSITNLGLTEGSYSMVINATGSSGQSVMTNRNFFVDTSGPEITFNTVNKDGNPIELDIDAVNLMNDKPNTIGDLSGIFTDLLDRSIKANNGKLMGTFTDKYSEIDTSTFEYRIDNGDWTDEGGIAIQTGPTTAAWEIPLEELELGDGVYLLSVRVSDEHGHPATENNMAFIIDTGTPTLTTVPIVEIYGIEDSLTISGTITETIGMPTVSMNIGGKEIVSINVTKDGDKGYKFSFPSIPLKNTDYTFNYASNSLVITATGSSGKTHTVPLNFTFDNKGPEISFNTTGGEIIPPSVTLSEHDGKMVSEWDDDYFEYLYETRIKSANARLSGRFTDEYSNIAINDGKLETWYQINGGILEEDTESGEWNYIVDEDEWILLDQTTTDPSRSIAWGIDLPSTLENGINILSIRVKDSRGNESRENMAFVLDRTPPVVAITRTVPVKTTYGPNDTVTISGTVTGTYALEPGDLTINVSGTQPPVINQETSTTFKFTYQINTANLDHGIGNISMTSRGSSEQSNTGTVALTVDKQAPVIAVNITNNRKIYAENISGIDGIISGLLNGSENPRNWAAGTDLRTLNDSSIKDSGFELTVTLTDDSGIKNAWYKLNNLDWEEVDFSDTDETTFVIPFSKEEDGTKTSLIRDGINKLSIRTMDEHGNGFDDEAEITLFDNDGDRLLPNGANGYETHLMFMVDWNVPEFGELKLGSNLLAPTELETTNKNFAISGKILNTFDVRRLSLNISGPQAVPGITLENLENGTDPRPANYLIQTEDVGQSFEFNINVPAETFDEGSYTITINATGSSGMSTPLVTKNFVVDRSGPEISLITLRQKLEISDDDYEEILQGGFADDEELTKKNDAITSNNQITDESGWLIGNFTDSFSPIASTFTYTLDIAAHGDDEWESYSGTLETGNTVDNINGDRTVAWRIPISRLPGSETVPFPDGTHRLSIEVKDLLGNETKMENIGFKVERGTPTLEINSPAQEVFFTNNFSITGTIEGVGDAILSATVNDINIPTGDVHFNKGTNISHTFIVNINIANLDETRHTVAITATTEGDNPKSDTKTFYFTYDKTAPEILYNMDKLYLSDAEMDAILDSDIDSTDFPGLRKKYDDLAETSFRSANASLAGNFSDALSLVYVDPVPDSDPEKSKPGNLGYWYKIDGIDGVNKHVDTGWQWQTMTKSDNRFVNWSIPLTGFEDGIYRLSLRVMDANGNGDFIDLENNGEPEKDSASGKPENSNALEGQHGYINNLAFRIDRGVTKLDIEDIPAFINDDLTITGTITNVFEVKNIEVKLDGTDVPESAITMIRSLDDDDEPISGSFDLSISIPFATGNRPQKSYSLIITATGSSDQSATEMLSFTFDNTGPEIIYNGELAFLTNDEMNDIINVIFDDDINWTDFPDLEKKYNDLTRTSFKNANASLAGNFSDDLSAVFTSANNGYWYKIDRIDYVGEELELGEWIWNELDVNDISAGSRFVNWNIPLPLADYKDGIYRLSLRVKDANGNGDFIVLDDDDEFESDSAELKTGSQNDGYYGYINNLAFRIDRSVPVLAVSTIPAFINGNVTITGSVSNTLSAGVTVQLGNDNINVPVEQSSYNSWTFSYDIPGGTIAEQAHSMTITATGASGQADSTGRNFTVHRTAPTLQFNTPSEGTKRVFGTGDKELNGEGNLVENKGVYNIYWSETWITGQSRIGGISDSEIGIDKIYYYLGQLGEDNPELTDAAREAIYRPTDMSLWSDTGLDRREGTPHNQSWSGGLYYWNFSTNFNTQNTPSMIQTNSEGVDYLPTRIPGGVSQFYLPMYVQVVDRAGNRHIAQYKIYVDPDMDIPMATIATPAAGEMVGGTVRISGMANDNNWINSVYIRITDTNNNYFKNTGDKWLTEDLDSKDILDIWPDDDTQGWVRASIQGPTSEVVSWFYTINSDGSLNPEPGATRDVTIEVRTIDTNGPSDPNPKQAGTVTSRSVTFLSEVPIIDPPTISKEGLPDQPFNDGIRVSGEFTIKTSIKDVAGLSRIRARQTGLGGYIELLGENGRAVTKDERPDNWPEGWEIKEPTIVNQSDWEPGYRYYIVEAGNISNWSEIDLSYNDEKVYGPGVMIQLKHGVNIDGSNATAFQADGNPAPSNWSDGSNDGSDKTPHSNWDRQYFVYDLEFSITSNSTFGWGSTGSYSLELQAYNPLYNTNASYSLAVDNHYPTADIETLYNAATSRFYVMGKARDFSNTSGSIQGLEKVLVYFQRGDRFYNATGDKTGAGDITDNMIVRPNVRDTALPPLTGDTNFVRPNVDEFENFPRVSYNTTTQMWESTQAIVIGNYEGIRMVGGVIEEQWEGRGEREWQARLDTNNFKDGPLTVHYIVIDLAGNATHYQDDIYIGNNKPLIRTVDPGTDVGGNILYHGPITVATVSTTDGVRNIEENYSVLTPNFRVRNNRFDLELDTLFGNVQKHYRVSYIKSSNTDTKLVQGSVYTIETHEGHVDFRRYGAPNNDIGTTFVASVSYDWSDLTGGSTTTVRTYTTGPEVTDSFIDSDDEPIHKVIAMFDSDYFGTGLIEDSGKDDNGVITERNQRRFIIKVFDETVTNGSEEEQLAHVVMIAVDVDNDDTIAPTINVAAFGEKYGPGENDAVKAIVHLYNDTTITANPANFNAENYLENIVAPIVPGSDPARPSTELRDRRGYVQYARHSSGYVESETTTHIHNVSGKVIFTGKAADNNRISRITAQIPGYNPGGLAANGTAAVAGSEFIIGQWNGSAIATPVSGNTIDAMRSEDSTIPWGFEVVGDEYLTLDYGHALNWAFAWDTSTISTTTANNVTITFRVYDTAVPANAPDASTIRVNIVPYITEVGTRLSRAYQARPSAFNRSALGWYPVGEGEIITIRGFNLRSSDNPDDGNPIVRINEDNTGIDFVATNPHDLPVNDAGVSKSLVRINVGTTVTSGDLEVSVNNIASINNRTNKTVAYNQEPNDLNNNILDNSRRLYVWNTGYMLDTTNVAVSDIYQPFMRMDNNANRLLSYGYYPASGQGRLRVNRNGTNYNAGSAGTNRMTNSTVATGGSNNSWYAAGSDITAGDTYPFLFGRSTADGANTIATGSTTATNGAANPAAVNIVSPIGSNSNRFRIPRIAVQPTNGTNNRTDANGDRILMSYFDGTANLVRVIYGNVGETAVSNISTTTSVTVASDTTNGTNPHSGSMYTAVGFLNNGLPVITWYDRLNQNLLFSYGSGTPEPDGTFTTTSSGTEFVYTALGHGLSAPATGNAATEVANSVIVGNTRHYVMKTSGDKISLNNATTANGLGQNNAGTNPVIIPYGFTTTIQGNSTANININGTNRAARRYRLANHNLRIGDQVRIVRADGTVETQNPYYVVWMGDGNNNPGDGTGNGNGNRDLVFATVRANQVNTNNQIYTNDNSVRIYPLTRNGESVTVTASGPVQERYYTFDNHGLIVDNTVTIGTNQYSVAEVWGNNFKLADIDTDNIVDLGAGPQVISFSEIYNSVYAGSRVHTTTEQWQANAAIIDTFKGTHVDMAVDGANNVHLAYYDVSNGGLYYALIPATGTGNGAAIRPNINNITQVRVDTYQSAGVKLMINVRQETRNGSLVYVPYISYAHASFGETRNSIRVAWRNNFTTLEHGTDEKDSFTGAWEVMTVPVSSNVLPDDTEFVCNGVPTGTGGWATQATGANQLRGYFVGGTNHINRSILVGYMTDRWYEGAVLKKDLW